MMDKNRPQSGADDGKDPRHLLKDDDETRVVSSDDVPLRPMNPDSVPADDRRVRRD